MVSFLKKHSADAWLLIVIGLIIALDQLTKFLIRNTTPKIIIPKVLTFTYITNTGAGFGILQGMNALLIIVSIAIIALLLYYYHTNKDEEQIPRIFFALIVGGALSNLIDRVLFGAVTDFIAFSFWPAFNIADSAITIGVATLIIHYIKNR
jgi:signal peptidase II